LETILPKDLLAIVIIAAAAAILVLAPSLSSNTVIARKKKTCTTGGSENPCHGNVSNTSAGHTKCTAGTALAVYMILWSY